MLAWEKEDARIHDLLHKRNHLYAQYRNAHNGFLDIKGQSHTLDAKAQLYWQKKLLKEVEGVNAEILQISKLAEREGVRNFSMVGFTAARQSLTRRAVKLGLLKYIGLPMGVAGMVWKAPTIYEALAEEPSAELHAAPEPLPDDLTDPGLDSMVLSP